jgi:GGDEF domain-containing protein
MAAHDALTGAANRNVLRERLDKTVAAVRQGDPGGALLAVV